jgi:membrane protein implicated in regulation of membrane protease activity
MPMLGGITTIWIIAGGLLCLVELLVPTAFVAFLMGISALLVALLSYFLGPPLSIQVLIWLGLSTGFIFGSRRFLRKPKASILRDAIEGRVITEIPAGQTGRVLYEGNSWQARCEDPKLTIAPGQNVYIVRRQGTTLIVVPEHLLHS